MDEPLSQADARREIRRIVTSPDGVVAYTQHAREEMDNDDLDERDITNALRAGQCEPAEWENGRWRYRVHRYQVWVVVQLIRETNLLVVTAWRKTR